MPNQQRPARTRRPGRIDTRSVMVAIGLFFLIALPTRVLMGQSPGSGETVEVGVYTAELRRTGAMREYVGRIDAAATVEVRARIEGFVDRQLFQDGSMVAQDELLFLIDPRQYEAEVAEARARLERARADLAAARASVEVMRAKADLVRDQATLANAEKDLARIRPLAEASAVSVQELDLAETKVKEATAVVEASRAVVQQSGINRESGIALASADVRQTSAALETALLNLSYTRVRSPITGMIGKAEVNVGSLVGRGDVSLLATVSQLDPIKVYFSLSEQEYLSVMRGAQERSGQPRQGVQFELVLANGQLFGEKGRFEFSDRAVDPQTGTLQLRAAFPNPGNLLRPGQFARVRVTDPEAPPAIVIPQRAVIDQQGEQFVLVVGEQGKVERKKVTLGSRVESNWIVSGGLQAGERVITDGLQKARPGMNVRVLESKQ